MPNFDSFFDPKTGQLTAIGKLIQDGPRQRQQSNHQGRMKQLEQKIFRELVLENAIVRAVTDHGNYNSLTQYDMLLEMVVALAETNKQLTDQIIQSHMINPKPMVIHCTPEQAALLMQAGEIKRMDDL